MAKVREDTEEIALRSSSAVLVSCADAEYRRDICNTAYTSRLATIRLQREGPHRLLEKTKE